MLSYSGHQRPRVHSTDIPVLALPATMLVASWVSPQGLSTQKNMGRQKSLIFRVQVTLLWLLGDG